MAIEYAVEYGLQLHCYGGPDGTYPVSLEHAQSMQDPDRIHVDIPVLATGRKAIDHAKRTGMLVNRRKTFYTQALFGLSVATAKLLLPYTPAMLWVPDVDELQGNYTDECPS